jgi:hypothetical protein
MKSFPKLNLLAAVKGFQYAVRHWLHCIMVTRIELLFSQDLHRTGCSLFCGAAAEENQALLKRVLLAYARWNKAVGYCQGFNMLAALILQVMDRSESDSVKASSDTSFTHRGF